MKIGVGVITMGLREINPKFYEKTTHEVFVYTDTERLGPGHARNQCLKHFDGYDHVFLFDDDAYPTRLGWEDYFIQEAQRHNVNYMALPDIFGGDFIDSDGEMTFWFSALGCFLYQDKHAMETIGGYNTAYNRYGYEDAARSHRAIKAGLTAHPNAWAFPIRGLSFIHSEDVFGENPTPNIVTAEKLAYIASNQPIYQKEIEGKELFYPYK